MDQLQSIKKALRSNIFASKTSVAIALSNKCLMCMYALIEHIKVCACYELHDMHNNHTFEPNIYTRKFIEKKIEYEHGKFVCVSLFSMKLNEIL